MGELSENQFFLWIVKQDKRQVEMSDFKYVHHSRLRSGFICFPHCFAFSL